MRSDGIWDASRRRKAETGSARELSRQFDPYEWVFDADAYDAAPEARAEGLDPALHYVLVGEGRTLKPSAAFDPVYYGERYPEVAAWGGNRLGHYLEWGSAQGRRALPIADTLNFPLTGIIPDRPTVIEGYSG
jgi:hypothetical protein